MSTRSEKSAMKAHARVEVIKLEEKKRKAEEKARNAKGPVAKAEAEAEVKDIIAALAAERRIIKPRRSKSGKRKGGGFFGALLGG